MRAALAALLLAALGARAQDVLPGNTYIPNDPVKVCITPYAPFTMNGSFATGTADIPGPIPYDILKDMTPINVSIAGDDLSLAGFDMDFSKLIFTRMLGLNLSYVAAPTFVEMYMSLRTGACDVGITAVEMDQTRTICLLDCPAPPFPPPEGDYSDGGFDEFTLSTLCCLEYGAPYLSSGFALLSKPTTAPFDVASALFNPDVCNAATVIVIMAIAAGWVASILERKNPHLGSVSRGSYWGLMQFLNSADEKPLTRPGRFLTILWLLASIVSLSVITSIISAKLTTAGLSSKKIMRLADIGSGALCVESAYPTAMQFVLRDPQHPVKIVEEEINVCISMLINGTVAAVFTDQPVLQWMVANYQIVNGFVSPLLGPNPFSFVYASGSLLRQYVNPSIIAAQTNPSWIPLASALNSKYFSTGADPTSAQPKTKVNIDTLVAAIIMFIITVAMAFLNGDCGPGIKSPAALRKLIAAPPMNPEEGAPGGKGEGEVGTEPSLREVMVELREVKALLQARGGMAGILPTLGGGMDGGANPFSRLKMPTWNLGGDAPPADRADAASVVGGSVPERGRKSSVPPAAAPSTASMQAQQQGGGGLCIPGLFGQPPPPPPPAERKARSRSKPRRERDNDRASYYGAQ